MTGLNQNGTSPHPSPSGKHGHAHHLSWKEISVVLGTLVLFLLFARVMYRLTFRQLPSSIQMDAKRGPERTVISSTSQPSTVDYEQLIVEGE